MGSARSEMQQCLWKTGCRVRVILIGRESGRMKDDWRAQRWSMVRMGEGGCEGQPASPYPCAVFC